MDLCALVPLEDTFKVAISFREMCVIFGLMSGNMLANKVCLLNKAFLAFVRGEMNMRWRIYSIWWQNVIMNTVDEIFALTTKSPEEQQLLTAAENCFRERFTGLWDNYKSNQRKQLTIEKSKSTSILRYINPITVITNRNLKTAKRHSQYGACDLKYEMERHWCALFFSEAHASWLAVRETFASELIDTGGYIEEILDQYSTRNLRVFLMKLFTYRANRCPRCKADDCKTTRRGETRNAISAHKCDGVKMAELLMRSGINASVQGDILVRLHKVDKSLLHAKMRKEKLPTEWKASTVFGDVIQNINLITTRMDFILEMANSDFHSLGMIITMGAAVNSWVDCPKDKIKDRLDFCRSALRMFQLAVLGLPLYIKTPEARAEQLGWTDGTIKIVKTPRVVELSNSLRALADTRDQNTGGTSQISRTLRMMATLLYSISTMAQSQQPPLAPKPKIMKSNDIFSTTVKNK